MDLDLKLDQASTAGSKMTLPHPVTGLDITGPNDKPTTFTMHGVDSDQYKAAERSLSLRRTEAIERTGRWTQTPEQQKADRVFLYASCCSGWDNGEYKGVTEYSPELITKLFTEQRWALDHAAKYVESRANFPAA